MGALRVLWGQYFRIFGGDVKAAASKKGLMQDPRVVELLQKISSGKWPPQNWRKKRLIATTLAAAASTDKLGVSVKPSFCIVDESSQLTEPALFAALKKFCPQRFRQLGTGKLKVKQRITFYSSNF